MITVKIDTGNTITIGNIYRSPNNSNEDNTMIMNYIKEASNEDKSNLILVGDFNFPNINWETWVTKTENTESQDYLFLECIRDAYLTQHITENTRARGADTPHLLDLILSNDENIISNISYEAPLGKSDHSLIIFNINHTPQ